MTTGLIADRVRGDVDVLARAGLDIDAFLEEAVASLGRALPFESACIGTFDPSTRLITGARKYGELRGANERDREWGWLEYGGQEPTSYDRLIRSGRPATPIRAFLDGDIASSPRFTELMHPYFGYGDELRIVLRDDDDLVWGGIALFRAQARFSEDDAVFAGGLAGTLARGVRAGLLAAQVRDRGDVRVGPVVIVVDERDQIVQSSWDAQERLDALVHGPQSGDPLTVVWAVVASARRYARGEITAPPRSRVRTSSGVWLVINATPLRGADGASGQVVVTIEEARPPEIVPIVVAAFQLTPRERDIVTLVLQGMDTKEIAATVHLSAYTVQDHLKSVFEKAGVRSRRELVSRIYFDQYSPRMGTDVGPSGWFVEA